MPKYRRTIAGDVTPGLALAAAGIVVVAYLLFVAAVVGVIVVVLKVGGVL